MRNPKKMNTFKNFKILILGTFLFIICFFCLLLGFNHYINRKTTEQTKLTLDNITSISNNIITTHIQNTFDTLTVLSNKVTESMHSIEDLHKGISQFDNICDIAHFKNIGIADSKGNAVSLDGTTVNIAKRAYFKESLNGKKYMTSILTDLRDAHAINIFSVPVYYKEEIVGVLAAGYDSTLLYQSLRKNFSNIFSSTYIIDDEGYLITTTHSQTNTKESIFETVLPVESEEASNIQKQLLQNLQNQVSSYKLYTIQGTSYYIYYKPLELNNWWVLSIIPETTVYEQTAPIARSLKLVSGLFFLIVIVFIIFTVYRYKKQEAKLEAFAFFDPVTHLHSRAYIEKFLHTLSQKSSYCLVTFDIKKFKTINELYGTEKGDSILQETANLLQQYTSSYEASAHSYGDEFLLIWKSKNLEERLTSFIKDLKKSVYNIDLSIGVYQFGEESLHFERVYSYAHLARKESKSSLDTKISYYSNELMDTLLSEREMEHAILQGIQNKAFKAWIQPKFDINGQLSGGEALVRWYHDGKIIFPDQFIEISESNGMIKEIDKLVIENVCQLLHTWQENNLKVCPISLNLSRVYLENGEILEYLKEITANYHIPHSLLQLEITESWFSKNEWKLEQTINSLHKEGFTILLDDFGTGYSSLKNISTSHFDILKIDKLFVDNLPHDLPLVKYTIHLAKSFSMNVIVEGVETKEQIDHLKPFHIDEFQGYYYSKPLTPNDFEKLLKMS